jgi:hypothetical protein
MVQRTCSVEGCERTTERTRFLCGTHRHRKTRGKDIAAPIRHYSAPGSTLAERLWERTDKSGECWIWRGAAYRYGVIRYQRHCYLVHRLAYELVKGPIPEGLTIDHLCMVRRCVNPAHMEPVTLRENSQREMAHRKLQKQASDDLHKRSASSEAVPVGSQ